MIYNNRKSRSSTPKPLIDAEGDLEVIAKNAAKENIKDRVYKGKRTVNGVEIFEVRRKLRELYYNKCAYCESKEHKPEVEHYRPKKGVKEEGKAHLGYYWLCYEWSNLLPACHYCNTDKGKKTQFPIIGKRVYKPDFLGNGKLDKAKCKAKNAPLINELPYLLHPEIDNPKPFFKFDTTGKIEGLDAANRGEKTIEICDLNRDNLLFHRKKLIDGFVKSINRTFSQLKTEILNKEGFKAQLLEVFKDLDEATAPNREFSLLAQYIQEHFEALICLQLSKNRNIVKFAYKHYRNENPIKI